MKCFNDLCGINAVEYTMYMDGI